MIAPLRRRHRMIWTAGVGLLPLVVLGATLARRPVPRQELPPPLLAAIAGDPTQDVVELATSEDLWPSLRIVTALERDARGLLLRLTPGSDPRRPDVLVYWSPSVDASSELHGLPADAVLLGGLAGTQTRRLRLPPRARSGGLLLYSLAHQELIGRAELAPLLRAGGIP